jgi:hypothetical protein
MREAKGQRTPSRWLLKMELPLHGLFLFAQDFFPFSSLTKRFLERGERKGKKSWANRKH